MPAKKRTAAKPVKGSPFRRPEFPDLTADPLPDPILPGTDVTLPGPDVALPVADVSLPEAETPAKPDRARSSGKPAGPERTGRGGKARGGQLTQNTRRYAFRRS